MSDQTKRSLLLLLRRIYDTEGGRDVANGTIRGLTAGTPLVLPSMKTRMCNMGLIKQSWQYSFRKEKV